MVRKQDCIRMKKIFNKTYSELLVIVLWIIAFHSFCVGVGLITAPSELFEFFGYSKCTERFFPTQGGVFHIVMAIGYIMGALRVHKTEDLVVFTIIVKLCATVFLLIYFIALKQTWLILFSGLSDGLMGLIVYWLYTNSKSKVVRGK